MTRRTLKWWMGGITASAALSMQAATPASADPTAVEAANRQLPVQILDSLDQDLDREGSWSESSFHFQKKSGFAYTHRFTGSDKPLVFKIQGPVMRKQKALGLTFKIRF